MSKLINQYDEFDSKLVTAIQTQKLIDTKEVFDFFKSLNIQIKLRYKKLSEVIHAFDTPQALGEVIYAHTKILVCYELIKNSKHLNLKQTYIILQTINKNEKIIKMFRMLDMEVFSKFWKLLINENRQRITLITNAIK